jgi:hypothetical protein
MLEATGDADEQRPEVREGECGRCSRSVLKHPLPRIVVSSSSNNASCILLPVQLNTMTAAAGILGKYIRNRSQNIWFAYLVCALYKIYVYTTI